MQGADESRAGQLLNQRYELHEPIRSTAESEVYRATDRKRHRGVHVELLRAEHALKPAVVTRFVQAPKQRMSLRHPNVLQVLAVESDDTGIPFVVEEDVDGERLSQVLARLPGGMSLEDAMPVLWPVAEALAAAHHLGLIHGQLGPEHVLLARVGAGTVPKVTHFGASSPGGAGGGGAWTRAPELRDGRAVADPRSDVWALGALAFAMLTGQAAAGSDGPRMALQACAPKLPDELRDLVERCLASEREDRPATAREVSGALSSLRVRLRGSGAAGPATPLPTPATPLAVPATPLPALPTPLPMPVTPLTTLAWNSGPRELALMTPRDTSEIWGPNDDDLDDALDAAFGTDMETDSGSPHAERTSDAASTDDNLEFDFDSSSDPADVDPESEEEEPPPDELDRSALPDLAALPTIVERDAPSPPEVPPHAVSAQRAMKSPPPVPPPVPPPSPMPPRAVAHEGKPVKAAPIVSEARAPAPRKKAAGRTAKRSANRAPAGARTPTAAATSAVVRAKSPQSSGRPDWFRQSGRAPARVVGGALATARASLFPPATPVEKETRRMRKVARRGDRSYWGALGSVVFLMFAVGLVFAVPLLCDPTRDKARVLLGARMQVAAAGFAAVTIVSLVRTWSLQTAQRPPMLRPVTTLLKPLTLIIGLLCATYFLPEGALGPVERAARALLPWVASGFYLFLALHGLVLAAREAASSVLYALLLALLHLGGFYGSFQVLAVTVLDKQAATGAEAEGFFTRLTGRGRAADSAPDAGVAAPEMPRGTTEGQDTEAEELGIEGLQRDRKRQQKQAGKLHNEVERMTR